MGDWIDRLKERDREQEEAERKHDEIRLHNVKIIRAKTATFWNKEPPASTCTSERD